MVDNLPRPALVLLIGPSGSGKSTFARETFAPTEIVSSDALRAWLADDQNDQRASADAFRIMALILNGRLKRRLTTVADATNLRAVTRRRLRALAARHGIPVVAILFDLPEQAYRDNNARRPDRRVSDEVIDLQIDLMNQAIVDVPREGYAAVYHVRGPAFPSHGTDPVVAR